jgi:iron-sulfur cluster repair protein YtfE (RIC family)
MTSVNGGSISVKELVDTMNTTMRIRCQMKDIGSYEQAEKVDHLKVEIDEILNPDKKELTRLFTEVEKGKESYIDSILDTYTSVQNNLTSILSKNNHLITSQIYSFIILPSIKIRLNILPSFFNLSLVLFGSSFHTTL